MPVIPRRFMLIGLALLSAGTAACFFTGESDDPVTPEVPNREIALSLRSQDTEAAHLFYSTETFPCCRVEPNASRTFTINAGVSDPLFVKAGRNGTVLLTKDCRITQSNFDSRSKTITWLGNGWSCGV